MTKILEKPLAPHRSAGPIDIVSSPTEHTPWPGSAPPSIPYAPSPTTTSKPKIVDSPPSKGSIQHFDSRRATILARTVGKARLRGAAMAPLAISTIAFVAWLVLMVTVVAEDGTVSQMIGITVIPLIAHVISVYLAGRSSMRHEAIGA